MKMITGGIAFKFGSYTDHHDNRPSDLQVSQQGAETICLNHLQQDVDPNALPARGFGDAKPVSSLETRAGWLQNRRIEVTLKQ